MCYLRQGEGSGSTLEAFGQNVSSSPCWDSLQMKATKCPSGLFLPLFISFTIAVYVIVFIFIFMPRYRLCVVLKFLSFGFLFLATSLLIIPLSKRFHFHDARVLFLHSVLFPLSSVRTLFPRGNLFFTCQLLSQNQIDFKS